MKLTLQFSNDHYCEELSRDIDINVDEEVMEHFEKMAKEHNIPVDEVIRLHLLAVWESFKQNELETQEEISVPEDC